MQELLQYNQFFNKNETLSRIPLLSANQVGSLVDEIKFQSLFIPENTNCIFCDTK